MSPAPGTAGRAGGAGGRPAPGGLRRRGRSGRSGARADRSWRTLGPRPANTVAAYPPAARPQRPGRRRRQPAGPRTPPGTAGAPWSPAHPPRGGGGGPAGIVAGSAIPPPRGVGDVPGRASAAGAPDRRPPGAPGGRAGRAAGAACRAGRPAPARRGARDGRRAATRGPGPGGPRSRVPWLPSRQQRRRRIRVRIGGGLLPRVDAGRRPARTRVAAAARTRHPHRLPPDIGPAHGRGACRRHPVIGGRRVRRFARQRHRGHGLRLVAGPLWGARAGTGCRGERAPHGRRPGTLRGRRGRGRAPPRSAPGSAGGGRGGLRHGLRGVSAPAVRDSQPGPPPPAATPAGSA